MRKNWAERLLEKVKVSEAGRPVLSSGEVECQIIDRVDIESERSGEETAESGLIILTNLRIVWLQEQSRTALSLPLSCISNLSTPKRRFKNVFSTPRLRLDLRISPNGNVSSSPAHHTTTCILFVFRGHANHDSFIAHLSTLLQSKSWEAVPPSPSLDLAVANRSNWNPSRAGVSGILRKEQEEWDAAERNVQEAFHDLNALMSNAKEMVSYADKMNKRLLSGDDDLKSKQEIQDLLLSVGIISPVTKESAGALYHQQLSRQLADFVWTPLQGAGGMLFVVDVYCLFNRARGTELISPDDLLQACELWERIDVPVKLRRFDSGALVVQLKSQNDEEVFAELMVLVGRPDNSRFGVSEADAANCLGVTPSLAKEHLLAAENKGLLCRDDGGEGLRFFSNFFKDAQLL